ncbi:hypothetical protein NKI25_36010, partial [Mesorhizobium sp. M0808]|uniref:hypothetical protein n=1 Tax=Mesorhizobium sp. M0808 TaxID=2957002 RepID=UPI003339D276
AHLLPSQGVHLFWWTPHASEHSTAKGAGKFALTKIETQAGAGQTSYASRLTSYASSMLRIFALSNKFV